MTQTTEVPPVEQFHDLIWQQAHRCNRRLPPGNHGMGLDDLFSEGLVVYAKFLRAFDPDRGCRFITGLTRSLMNHYAGIVRTAWRRPTLVGWDDGPPDAPALDEMVVDTHEPSLRASIGGRLAEMVYTEISREAWSAARAVLDPPAGFIRYCSEHHGLRLDTLLFDWLRFAPAVRRRVRRELALACSPGADRRAGRQRVPAKTCARGPRIAQAQRRAVG